MISRVLVVEDNGILALELQLICEAAGYTVIGPFPSGSAAVEAARKSSPDLLLCDICIEGDLDGIEVAEQIRRFLDLPIIFISALSDPGTRRRIDEVPGALLLQKPVDTGILLSLMSRMIVSEWSESPDVRSGIRT